MKENSGILELQLANGKSVVSTSGFELACFLASGGSSIVPLPARRKGGGKSKGARNKGKSKVTKVA